MKSTAGSVSGLVGVVLTWGFVWAFPGGVIEAIDNIAPAAHSFTRQIDMWPQTLGLPGLLAGLVFSVLLLTTDRQRRLADVALRRAGAWGLMAGVAVGALVVWVIEPGLSRPATLAAALVAYAALMGAAAGVGSIVLFRSIAHRRALPTS